MSDAAFTHDIFLSHTSKDKAAVRAVAERLRAAVAGRSEFALRTSDFALPNAVLFRDPSDAGRRLLSRWGQFGVCPNHLLPLHRRRGSISSIYELARQNP
jgi:hypothetical protein